MPRTAWSIITAVSVHANGLELMAPGVRNGGFSRVRQHDRRTVGRMQSEELDARRDFWRLRKQIGDVLGTDRLHVSKTAVAELCQCLLRNSRMGCVRFNLLVVGHGPRLLSGSTLDAVESCFTSPSFLLVNRDRFHDPFRLWPDQINR